MMYLFDNLNSIYTFTNLLNEPGCKFWINEVSKKDAKALFILLNLISNSFFNIQQKGYHYFKYFPLFKTEYLFDSKFTMDQVIQACHDPQRRVKWDKNIDKIKILRKVNRVQILHTVNTPHILENTVRDMYEKKVGFTYRPPVTSRIEDQISNSQANFAEEMLKNDASDDGGVGKNGFNVSIAGRSSFKFKSDLIEYYMFSSSIDNKEMQSECQPGKDHLRIQVYLTLQKFELVRVEEAKGNEKYQVKMTGFLQCDPKLSKLKYGIYRTALPNLTRDFYTSLVGYLESSSKKK